MADEKALNQVEASAAVRGQSRRVCSDTLVIWEQAIVFVGEAEHRPARGETLRELVLRRIPNRFGRGLSSGRGSSLARVRLVDVSLKLTRQECLRRT